MSTAPVTAFSLPAVQGHESAIPDPFRFIKPTLPSLVDVVSLYDSCYADGTITNAESVAEFEKRVAERIGVEHCVAVSSCTSGLMMTLRALNLSKPEVILPSFTFFATAHAVLWNGLTPVFADCDPRTWNLDPESVASKITSNTGAIIGVHLYGNPCDTDALEALAAKHGLPLLFDAAHGFGSARRGRPVGQFGTAEIFSLSPTKLLVAGEGGLVTTNNGRLSHSLRAARNYGDLGAYDPIVLGVNARMSEFNAALGLAGLPKVDSKVQRHNSIAALYDSCLSSTAGLRFQFVDPRDRSTFKDYSVVVDPEEAGITRDELANRLLERNIPTKKYFSPPVHKQALYTRYHNPAVTDLACTEYIAANVLSLPVYESLSDNTVRAVSAAIQEIIAR